jgi:hypothetical protein
MSLLDRPVRPKPAHFGPDGAPPGIALRLDVYNTLDDGLPWATVREACNPNTIVGHTNAASVEASVQSSINYGRNTHTRDGRNTTKPHYLLGDKPAKVLRTDKRAIANSTGSTIEQQFGVRDSSYWSIAVETADMGTTAAAEAGYPAGDLGPFLYDNADDFAHVIAYESIVWGYPIRVPPTFTAGGVVAHTWPYPYPYFTTKAGKTCPGGTKIAAIRYEIIPRAIQIRAAWTAPPAQPDQPEDSDMARINGIRLQLEDRDGRVYLDQIIGLTLANPAHLEKLDADDDRLVRAKLDATRAEIEAELGFKLTPST